MSARKEYQIAFQIAARMGNTFRAAFNDATDQVGSLKTKAASLNQELRTLDRAYKKGEIGTEEYTESQSKLKQELDRVAASHERLSSAIAKRDKYKQKRDELGGKAAGTAAMAAPLVAVTAAAYEYQEAQRRVQIQSNMTAAQSQAAFKTVRAAYVSGLGEDVQAVSYSYGLMSQIIKNESAEQQKSILQGALVLEKYWQQDTQNVSKAVHNLTSNFKNLSNTQAMDIVTAGFQNGLNYADDYLDTLYEYAPQFETLGYSAQQFYGILEAGKKAGAWNLDKVADAVKEFNIRAKDGSDTTAEGFAMVGLDAGKMAQAIAKGGDKGVEAFNQTIKALQKIKDPVKQNQAGVALFGTQWEDLTAKVVLGMNITAEGANKTAGAMKKVVDAATGAQDGTATWAQMTRQLQDTASVVGNNLLPVLAPMLQDLSQGAVAVSNFAQQHPQLTQGILMVAGGLVVLRMGLIASSFATNTLRIAAGNLGIGLGRMSAQQVLAAQRTTMFTRTFGALSLAFRANPIGFVITAIQLLIGAFVLAYSKIEWFRNAVDKAWAALKRLTGFGGGAEIKYSASEGYVPGKQVAHRVAAHAGGGIFNRPHIGMVAEAGVTEAIIPFDGSRRSESIWRQAGAAMGMGGGGTVINVNFSPVINGGNAAGIKPILEEQQKSFMDQLKDVLHQQRRVSYDL